LKRARLAICVLLAHLIPLFFLPKLEAPKKIPKPIVVHTLYKERVVKAPIKQPQSPVKRKPQKKKTNTKEVEKIFAKIERASKNKAPKTAMIESAVPSLTLSSSQEKICLDNLFDYLQSIIELPKKGSIKLSFLIDSSRHVTSLKIEEGAEIENVEYLNNLLAGLLIPKELAVPLERVSLTLHGVEN
jgi:hypothetical protein